MGISKSKLKLGSNLSDTTSGDDNNVYISSNDLQNNLSNYNGIPVYVNQIIWGKTSYPVIRFFYDSNNQNLLTYDLPSGNNYLQLKIDLSSGNYAIPTFGPQSSASIFILNSDGNLYTLINGNKYWVYHIGKLIDDIELPKFLTFYSKVMGKDWPTNIDKSIAKDIGGWRIDKWVSPDDPNFKNSSDYNQNNQKYSFVVRGNTIKNVFPQNPTLYPPKDGNPIYDNTNWPFKLLDNFNTLYQGDSTGGGDHIGRCPNKVVSGNQGDNGQFCTAGVPSNIPDIDQNTYNFTSSIFFPWNNSPIVPHNLTQNGINYGLSTSPDQNNTSNKLILVKNSPQFSTHPSTYNNVWDASGNEKIIMNAACTDPFVPIGSIVNSTYSGAGGTVPNTYTQQHFACVNKNFLDTNTSLQYPSILNDSKVFWTDQGGNAKKSAVCAQNNDGNYASLTCASTSDSKYSDMQSSLQSVSPPFKLKTFSSERNRCASQSGDTTCDDIMTYVCSSAAPFTDLQEKNTNDCLQYIRSNLANTTSTSGPLYNWLSRYCNSLDVETKLNTANRNFCACFLTDDEYKSIKDKQFENIMQ
jgi:hypothetical protein